jgi:hypothetical protein
LPEKKVLKRALHCFCFSFSQTEND